VTGTFDFELTESKRINSLTYCNASMMTPSMILDSTLARRASE
jgi:hypothetical protein